MWICKISIENATKHAAAAMGKSEATMWKIRKKPTWKH
jgi:hypothetical protein